jgi:hypothetical protein
MYPRAFVAGFVSTLVFHQGVYWLLYQAGSLPRPPWNMAPVPPLGVPAVVSLAFWGGLWGIALWLLVRRFSGARRWALAIGLGALLPSLVALAIVFPLKGGAFFAGGDPKILIGALLLNGAWGFGVALLMKLMGSR